MASYNEEFNQYRIFLENIAKSVVPQDSEVPIKASHLRNRISCHSDAEGEVIYWILKFLDEKKCPTKLIAPIVRNVLIEIQDDPQYKDPKGCPDFRGLAITVLEGFCIRLLDNVELNKILDTATSHSAQQQQNDDLLSIPIRTAAASQNKRRKMEDRSICIDEFHKVYAMKDSQKRSFYGVFDGHSGYKAAQYAASQLPFTLSQYADTNAEQIDALCDAFKYTDEKFISKTLTSGTTATCTLYRPDEGRLYIAWVGDSKAMLAKQHGQIMQLVTSHRPDLKKEKNRIRSLGGSIHFISGEYRVNGCLNVTRSIGDIQHKAFLISQPDCVTINLDKTEEFLVLATDGLWDYATDADVAKTVYDCIKEDCENIDQIPNRLIELAQDHQSSDNILVVVIFFKQPSQIAKNCDNLTIMESQFDNIKEVDYYNSRNLYPSEENSTSNSHAIDAKQMRWSPNDNLNNIINEEVKQTTTTTTSSTNNGQFDDNLLYSSDNIDLIQKSTISPNDDNNMHHASTLENNGEEEEQLLGASFDNKNLHEQLTTAEEFDNEQQKLIEKNQPHQQQQLGDTDADYGPETCVDVTDDVVMMTENSADTNNLLEQSVLSHSKDTLPSSDNCNPFDNKNTLDMEDGNEFQLGSGGIDAQLHLDDANKSTPLLSPEVEDLPLSSEGGMQYTNEGFQQSPLDEEIPVGMDSHQEHVAFEEDFMPRNGHMSPVEMQHTEEEKLDVTQKAEEPESLSNLEELEKVEEEKLNKEECSEKTGDDLSHQETDLDEEEYMGKRSESPVIQQENLYEHAFNAETDEADFRSKDEEEILEKHVEPVFVDKEHLEPESEVLDMSQRDELQQSLHNLEVDILEEKPILTGNILDNLSPLSGDEEKLNDFVEEKQDREEFSEKEDKMEDESEKQIAVEQNGKNIELEEDECIHLEEDVRPSDYLAMLERQKLEVEQEQTSKVEQLVADDNQLAEEGKLSLEQSQEELIGNYQEQGVQFGFGANHESHMFEDEDDRLSDKVEQLAREKEFEKDERLSDIEQFDDKKIVSGEEYEQQSIDEKFNDEVEQQYLSQKVDEKLEMEQESYDEKFDQEEKEQLLVEKVEEAFDVEEELYNEKFDKEEKEELPVEKVDETEKEQLEQTEQVEEERLEKAAEELESVDQKVEEVEKEPLPIESAPERLQELVSELEIPAKELVEEICEQVEQVYSENNDLTEQLKNEKQDKADEKLDKQVEQIDQNEHYDMDDSITAATEQLEQQRHLNDIEIMSQQIDRFEKEDQEQEKIQEQFDVDQQEAEERWSTLGDDSFEKQTQEQDKPSETLNEKQNEELESEQTPVHALEDILSKTIDTFPTDNKYQSEEQPLSEEPSPVLDEAAAQPEKQCFEEPEKNVEELLPQLDVDDLVLQAEEPIPSDTLPISPQPPVEEEETENKFLEDPVDEIEKQLEEVNEKVLSKIENQILASEAPFPKPRVSLDKPVQEYDEEPEELVEVEEPLIIKEQVPIKPSALSVTSQEPSAVPPTHESCDESEDDEWKYMKEGQGEKQLLGLQGDIVVEEDLQPLQEEIIEQQQPEAIIEQQPLETTPSLTEEVIKTTSDQIETIKDTFESLTQNIADLAENAAAATETEVDKIGDTLESLNLSQSSTREKLDNLEDDEDISASEMNSKLNPEAKEFIPTFSPTGPVDFTNGMSFGAPAAKAIPPHFKDELIAQSPRKGRESNMENINIPAENEFDEEIAHKPHGLPGDEIITENVENGGLYQEMNWKEAMHGSEKEEGPLVDSPITEESLEVVENVLQYGNAPNLCDFSAPVGLDNAGMKESIYIENNTSQQSNEEDVLNTVQVLPVENESQENSLEAENACKEEIVTPASESAPVIDVVTENEVQEILTLAGAEKKEEQIEENIEKRMEELLLSHDREITKDVPVEAEQVPINGVEMSPTEEIASTAVEAAPVVAAIAMGTVAAVAVAATTTAVKKAEAEKNQKNLIKTSSATKSKVPDTKKPASATASKTVGSAATAAKRSLGDKPKPSAASSLAAKKTSSTTTAAPRPRTAPSTAASKTIAEKKTTTTTTSTAKSRIDSKAPTTLAARKPLTSTATKTSASKAGEDAKSSNTTVKSSISGKPLVGSKTSVGSAKPLSAANSITKPRPATASAAATTNGTATKTAASKPTTLAPKSAGHTKPSATSPRGTLTSTLRKTEAIKILVIPRGDEFKLVTVREHVPKKRKIVEPERLFRSPSKEPTKQNFLKRSPPKRTFEKLNVKSPVKTTASTITSRTSLSTNGTKTTTSTRTTTTTKTSLSTVPATAAKSTTGTTTTTRRTLTSSGTPSTVGATTPTSKTPNNLVSRKSTPLKKTTTPAARKSIGSKLNASATKPTKDTTTPRPVTIPPQHQNNNNSIVEAAPKAEIIPLVSNDIHDTTVTLDNGEPKLNGVATPDIDLTSPTAPVAQSLVEIA